VILNLDHFHIHQQELKLNKENMNVELHHNSLKPSFQKKKKQSNNSLKKFFKRTRLTIG
jgi:hypothetical protein